MKTRHIVILMIAILLAALVAYAYLNSREAAPLQNPSPDAARTGALERPGPAPAATG